MEKESFFRFFGFIRSRQIGTMFFVLSLPAPAQEIDPFAPEPTPPSFKLVYEVFSLPLGQAAALQRAGLSDAKFYQQLVSGLDDETVTLETFLTVRGSSGSPMTASAGQDYRHPKGFDPPEIPNQVTGPGNRKTEDGKEITVFPANPSNPTSYETRFLGETLTARVRLEEDGRLTLEIQPTRTILLQKDVYGRGLSRVEYPRFAVPRIETGVTTTSGIPFLLGTVSPPAERQPKNGESLAHLAFVTATHLETKEERQSQQ